MQELIKITEKDGKQLISARELHKVLGNKRQFTNWVEPYVKDDNEYLFEKNVDFTSINAGVNPTNNIPTIDYAISIEMAKEISMVSKSEKGKEVRQYFIQCEKALRENVQALNTKELSPELQMFGQLYKAIANTELEQKQIKAEIQDTKDQLQGIRDVVALTPNAWRKDTSCLISKIAMALGGFEHMKDVREESYKLLNETYKVNVKQRLVNKQKNVALEGCSKTKINKLNYLDVIAEDEKLINGYISIISKMAIKYGAI